jgi:5-methylthioadenosine/S-adenosylhomocysteine deaminase
VRIAELLASLSQIKDGVTTTVDTSQVQLTAEHTDASIAGLKESGRRCLFAYGAGGADATRRNPLELARLRKQYFSSDDQLLTLAMNAAVTPEMFEVARAAGVPTVFHCQGGNFNEPAIIRSGLMGPDHEYIHCTRIGKEMFKAIADTGGKVSIAVAIEMQMGHSHPPLQEALDLGIRPSLSVDVECNMTSDSFTQMRAAFTWQRAMANERTIQGEKDPPRLLTSRDVIEFATIEGAKCTHLDSKIGTLTPGKEADIVMIRTDAINLYPSNNALGTVVAAADRSNVDTVIIGGVVRKQHGKLVGVDMARFKKMADDSRAYLFGKVGYKPDIFAESFKI